MDSQLAITKTILPTKRASLLSRPRLLDFLHEHIERKLILVSASAGYGKTSLLIDFAHDTTFPVCWYSLDPNDSDPRLFLEYLVASLRRQFQNFGSRTLRVLSESGPARDFEIVVGSLVTEIHESIPGYFVLVLDDYQAIEESVGVNRILDSLLRLLPENAHLILSGRTLPKQLTLTRLAAHQEIAGIGTNELKFSPDEVCALVKQNYQIDLSEEDAANLAENSEGWITGIMLTTQSLWKGLFQNLVRVPGSHGQLFSYLASEVFNQQSPALQKFLLESSILRQFNAAFCSKLFAIENASELLTELEQKNLFVVRIDGDETWFRYHHLFQQFLQDRLKELDNAQWQFLHRRASEWFESQQAWDRAIEHYQVVQAFEQVARQIGRIAKQYYDAGHWTTLANWIDGLPEDLLDAYPSLIIWRARIFAETGALDRALGLYARAHTQYEKAGDRAGIGQTLVRQSVCLRFQGSYEQAIEHSQAALELLANDDKRSMAEAHRTIGISNGQRGKWRECIKELECALNYYNPKVDHVDVALIYQDLGVARRTLGDRGAQRDFQAALDQWRLANNLTGMANTLNSIGITYHRQNNYSKAIEILQNARSEARRSGQLRIEAHALASLGDVYRDRGELDQAQKAYRSAFEIGRQISEGFIITYTLCALGELLHLTGDVESAQELLTRALEQALNHRSNYEIGLAKTALGIFDYRRGAFEEADSYLNSALALFEEGGAKRDSARAHLHLASANFQRKKYRSAGEHLRASAILGKRLQEDQFVVSDGPRILPLLRYAVSKKIGNGYYSTALEKVAALPSPAAFEEHRAETSMPVLKAYAFGRASVLVGEQLVTTTDWDSNSAKELFFLLLAHPHGLRKEEILEKLWQQVSPSKASAIFHSTAHRARRALQNDCIVYENGVYRLDRKVKIWVDVARFEELIAAALRTDSDDDRASQYGQAVQLYAGDYFEDSYNDWCVPIRAALLSKYLDALHAVAFYHASRSQLAEALGYYRRILDKDPLREEIYRQVMQIQLAMGDRSGAIKTFEQCERILREELNLTPSEETRILDQRISARGSNA